jgi:hypothetical protein
MTPRIHPFDIGCEPSPSVPAETLLADGWKTYLLFLAVSKTVDESGYLKDLGVAVLHCDHCLMSKFGYPNDEGLHEHPLWEHGLADSTTSVVEVLDSPWAHQVSEQMLASARRIWGGRGMSYDWARDPKLRHFVVLLKEKTFECLASSIRIEKFCKTFDEAYSHVIAEFAKH